MRLPAAFAIGLLFGTGILVAGMANPAKILNFFDVAGHWDPSLAFVMVGGLLVNVAGYAWARRRARPLLTETFDLPATSPVTARLIAGAAVFGIGWGLSGFCPGGVVPVLAIGRIAPVLFFCGLVASLAVLRAVAARRRSDPLNQT